MNLLLETRTFPAQSDQVLMQKIKGPLFRALSEVEFATLKVVPVGRHRKRALHFRRRQRRKLREKFEAPLPDRLAQILVADVREENEGSGRAKFLALEKKRCPRTEQEQRSHGAISPRRSFKAHPRALGAVGNLVVVFNERHEGRRRRPEGGHAAFRFLPRVGLSLKEVAILRSRDEFLRPAKVIV